jgi:hypothetical protein
LVCCAKKNLVTWTSAGLPDGLFSNQKSHFGTFFGFGIMYQEKSGNPGRQMKKALSATKDKT